MDLVTRMPHKASDHITKVAPVVYDAKASCPQWHRFLERVMPDPELRRFVQRMSGSALVGINPDQVLFILWGHSATTP